MTKTYLLLDLQNRCPEPADVARWMGSDGETWVFYGAEETGLLPQYWELGEQISIVPITKPGKNSLDFHLVLYLGYLVAKAPRDSRFVVVSGDTDFDPAILHAKGQGINVQRLAELAPALSVVKTAPVKKVVVKKVPAKKITPEKKMPAAKKAAPAKKVAGKAAKTPSALYDVVLADINSRKRPRNLRALTNRIQAQIGPVAAPDKITSVLERLRAANVITVTGGQLKYV